MKVIVRDPIEFQDVSAVSIPEDAQVGDFVSQLQAVGDDGSITYAITGGNVNGAFQIESDNGMITVASLLDFETEMMYTLTVEATNITSGASGTVDQIILVSDVNEQPFFITECAIDNNCVFSVDENRAVGTLVETVEADDPDDSAALNGQLEFTLSPDSVPFQISETGELRTTAILVHELMPEYTFDITVRDMGDPRLGITTSVTVLVIDLAPDFDVTPPVFFSSCDVSVLEIDVINIPLTQCIAVDFNDATNMTSVVQDYKIVDGNVGNAFAFDPTRGPGVIINIRPLDREDIDSYNLTIQANDSVGLTGTTNVVITILDINDNAPQFVNPPITVLLTDAQIQSFDTSVVTLQAVDADIGENGLVQYSITHNQSQITVTASDLGTPSLSSSVTVTVMFESPCVFQEYAIDANSGAVTSQLFCSVVVEPSDVSIPIDGSQILMCRILRNVDASYRWLQDDSFITDPILLPLGEVAGDLIIFNAQFSDEGEYKCRATSELGSLLSSNAATVTVLGMDDVMHGRS